MPHTHLPLLAVDGEWGSQLPPEELALARRAVALPRIDRPRGVWEWGPTERAATGILIVKGVVLRHTSIGGRTALQVHGPGDVLLENPHSFGEFAPTVTWSVKTNVIAVALDSRFTAAARRWPQIGEVLHERLAAQVARGATETAIVQLPRVEWRLLAMLWHLAERFGRVGASGVTVSLGLTHSELGRLCGAQRPTISLALAELAEHGALLRHPDGHIALRPGGLDALLAAPPARVLEQVA